MLKTKIIMSCYDHDLEHKLNEFLKNKNSDQIVNLYYTATSTQYTNNFSVIVLYNDETVMNNKIEINE